MSDMQAFGSWRIILLDSDSLGDEDDVLTRVGAHGAEFKPGGGGSSPPFAISDITGLQAALDAVTFDQDLNTTNDVEFASVSGPDNGPLIVNNGLIVTLGDITANGEIELANGSLKVWQDSRIQIELVEDSEDFFSLFRTSGGEVFFGTGDYQINVESPARFLLPMVATEIKTNLGSTDPLNLAPDGDIQINGTPGVTEQIVITGIGTLDLTKGLATGWTPV